MVPVVILEEVAEVLVLHKEGTLQSVFQARRFLTSRRRDAGFDVTPRRCVSRRPSCSSSAAASFPRRSAAPSRRWMKVEFDLFINGRPCFALGGLTQAPARESSRLLLFLKLKIKKEKTEVWMIIFHFFDGK